MQSNDTKVSIIVPVFNAEKYLKNCLESLVHQTLKDIEIICINDGSTDKSETILSEYANIDTRIKIISQKNQKQGAARNRGLENACGKYTVFVDADDYIDIDYCEKMYNIAEKYNADIVSTNLLKHKKKYNRYNVSYKEIKEAVGTVDKINICKDNKQRFFNVTNKIFKNDFLQKNNILFAENCYVEDVMFMAKTIYAANKIISCPNTTYHYITNTSSTVKSKTAAEKKKQDHVAAYTELQIFAKEKNITLPERLNYIESYFESPFIKTYKGTFKTKKLLFGLIPVKIKYTERY
ncbi:MAG: glycosyltransferase [Lentisphaeria bacterium]|nr:glycosyltransferase [Lentisphaeria bacterium]